MNRLLATLCLLLATTAPTLAQRFQASVTTLADLRSYQLPNNNTNVWVAGRTAPGDGFEGVFTWFTGSTTATNLGTVFATTRTGATVPAGRWIRQYDGPINVQWFGPPSATVETAFQFNDAINYGVSLGGATVFVPRAIYKVRGEGTNGVVVKNKIAMAFEPGTELRMGTAIANDSVALFVSTANGIMDDIEINGPVLITGDTNSAFTQYGVALNVQASSDTLRNVRIRNVTIRNMATDGISVGGNPAGYGEALTLQWIDSQYNKRHGGSSVNVRGLLVEDSIFSNNTGDPVSSGWDSEPNATLSNYNTTFRRCKFNNNLYKGLYIQRGNGVEVANANVDQCEMYGNGSDGYSIIATNVDVTDTHSATNGGFGANIGQSYNIRIKGGNLSHNALSGVQVGQSANVTIDSVTITGNTNRGVLFNGSGDTNRLAQFNTLTGCTISSNLTAGVELAGASVNTVTANTITKNGTVGIWLTQSSSGNIVADNVVLANSAAGGSDANIRIDGGCIGNTISDNNTKMGTKWVYGNARAGTGTSVTLPAYASELDNYYLHETLRIVSGTGSGQTAVVTSYVGATKVAGFTGPFAPAADTTSVVEVTAANRPTFGLIISSTNAWRNRVFDNDFFRGGSTGDWTAPFGADATIGYLPINEGGTSTNDLAKLPGDVGSVGGNFLLDNNHYLRVKDTGGTSISVVGMDTSNNTLLQSSAGGDIKLQPNGNPAIGVEVTTTNGFILYKGVSSNSILYTTSAKYIKEVTLGPTIAPFTGTLDVAANSAIQKLEFARNSGAVTSTRKQLNVIEGTGITLALADDAGGDRANLTITAATASGVTNFSVGTMSPMFTASATTTYPLLAAVDPGGHRVWGWDNTDNLIVPMILSTGSAYDSATRTWTFSGGGGGSATNAYGIVMEEGVALPAQTNLNFVGGAITAANNAGAARTDVTLSQSPAGSTSVVGTGRTLTTTAPITGGGDLSVDRTLALTTSPVGATTVVGTGRTIGTSEGVKGGGDLAADRTLSADIPGLIASTTTDPSADYVMVYRAAPTSAHQKVLIQDVGGGTGLDKSYRTRSLTPSVLTTLFTMAPTGNRAGLGVEVQGVVVSTSASQIAVNKFRVVIGCLRDDSQVAGSQTAMSSQLSQEISDVPWSQGMVLDDGDHIYYGTTSAPFNFSASPLGWTPTAVTLYYKVEQYGPGTITFF